MKEWSKCHINDSNSWSNHKPIQEKGANITERVEGMKQTPHNALTERSKHHKGWNESTIIAVEKVEQAPRCEHQHRSFTGDPGDPHQNPRHVLWHQHSGHTACLHPTTWPGATFQIRNLAEKLYTPSGTSLLSIMKQCPSFLHIT